MCPNELVTMITALSVTLADGKTPTEIALLGTIFTQIGDTLTTLAAQKAICQQNENRNS